MVSRSSEPVNDDVADLLSHLHSVKPKGNGGWTALCPAHDDHKRSLSIDVGRDGKILLRCFSGCEFQAILAALNLPRRPHAQEPRDPKRVVATYDYRDEAGKLRYQAVRYEPKEFTQRHPNGNGAWDWNLNGVERLPYRLPELLRANPSDWHFIPEGEKDVDAMLAAGFSASTNSEGAVNWKPELNRWYVGRRVCVLLDNDPNQEIRDRRAALLRRNLTGIAAHVEVRLIPGLPEKGDVSDWLAESADPLSLYALLGLPNEGVPLPNYRMVDQIPQERVNWIWYGFLAEGKITLLDGVPKLGKSTLTADFAARITRGLPFAGPVVEGRRPRGVVMLSAEDGAADTIAPRLSAAGADLSKVAIVDGVPLANGSEGWITLDQHLSLIEALVRRIDAQLIIIDPLMAYLGQKNAYKDQDMRAILGPVKAMAERTRCSVIIIRHLNKATSTDIIMRGGGSVGIAGAARLGMLVGRDPENDDARILAQSITNLTRELASLRFVLAEAEGTDVARVVWDDMPAPYSVMDLLEESVSEDEKGARSEAAAWLEDFLRFGPRPANDVQKAARADGHSERTMDRAKASLGVRSLKDDFAGGWKWHLPRHIPHSEPETKSANSPLYAKFGALRTSSTNNNNNMYFLGETKKDTSDQEVPSSPCFGKEDNVADLADMDLPWDEEEGQS